MDAIPCSATGHIRDSKWEHLSAHQCRSQHDGIRPQRAEPWQAGRRLQHHGLDAFTVTRGMPVGSHSKPEKPLSEGKPPPGNSDGRVEKPPPPSGTRRK